MKTCYKCGKTLSFLKDNVFEEKIDENTVVFCEDCHRDFCQDRSVEDKSEKESNIEPIVATSEQNSNHSWRCTYCGKIATQTPCEHCGDHGTVSPENVAKAPKSVETSNKKSMSIVYIAIAVIVIVVLIIGVSISSSKTGGQKTADTTTTTTEIETTTSKTTDETTENTVQTKMYPDESTCVAEIKSAFSSLAPDGITINFSKYEQKEGNVTAAIYNVDWYGDIGTVSLISDTKIGEEGEIVRVVSNLKLPNMTVTQQTATYIFKIAAIPVYAYANKWGSYSGTFDNFCDSFKETNREYGMIFFEISGCPEAWGSLGTSTLTCVMTYSS